MEKSKFLDRACPRCGEKKLETHPVSMEVSQGIGRFRRSLGTETSSVTKCAAGCGHSSLPGGVITAPVG